MSLFRKATAPVATPRYTGLQVQTASSALPIPIVYGITRVAPNLIWSGNFQSHPQPRARSGGKGGGGQSAPGATTYSAALVFALGEGPITAIGTVYRGQGRHNPGEFFLSLVDGSTPQAPWGYLAASFPEAALAYGGTAYAASPAFDLGTSASIDTIAFEVYGRLYPSAVVNAHDADPAAIIGDFLTNAQYGVGFPAASLDATSLYGASGDGSYQTWCRASGLALSPALTDGEAANAILARWLQLTGATAVWSGGRLKIVPLGDAPVSGVLQGGATVGFVPSLAPAMDLGDDDFVGDGNADPLVVSRGDPQAAPNLQRLEILDRANSYSATPIEARDQNAIESTGLIAGATITAHEICDVAVGAAAAQLILQRGLFVRNSYSFRLSWDCCLLEPMDVVTLTDAGLGLDRAPVRVTAIAEDGDGLLQVTAEELPGTVATAPLYRAAGAAGSPVDRAAAPAPVNPPVIFEPPADLTGGAAQVWIGLSGGSGGVADPNWGGAVIHVSGDGASFAQVGTVTAPARQGVLVAPLAAPEADGGGDGLAVSLAESGGVLDSSAPLTCWVDGEIVAAAGATLVGPSTYALAGLARRLHGLRGGAHSGGAPVLVLDDAVYRYDLPAAAIGRTLFLKFASFNRFGQALQDLSTCATFTLVPVGSGLFGPVAQALAVGSALDDGAASAAVGESDSFGLASDPYSEQIDMGLASDGTQALAIGAGGTGAVSPAQARANLGAAAAGANSDITSLTGLAAVGIGTLGDTVTNRLAVRSASVLFDNIGAGTQVVLDKAGAGDTGALLYQTGYSGRAVAGLIGSDRYRITVSADGASFAQALDLDPASGHVGLAGYTADETNALGVRGTAVLFAAATDSLRLTLDKTAAANDAGIVFTTGFSARALVGTFGADDFGLKVSADGASFAPVFVVDRGSGNIGFKALVGTARLAVAALPPGVDGALAFAADGCKAGEASGAGTGTLVAYSNGAWRRLSDDSVVAS